MGDVYLNGRPAVDWEVPVIARVRECPMPPDCAENRVHRAAVGALRAVFRAASANAEAAS